MDWEKTVRTAVGVAAIYAGGVLTVDPSLLGPSASEWWYLVLVGLGVLILP